MNINKIRRQLEEIKLNCIIFMMIYELLICLKHHGYL